MIIRKNKINIYFGDIDDPFVKSETMAYPSTDGFNPYGAQKSYDVFGRIAKKVGAKKIFFANQVHGSFVHRITKKDLAFNQKSRSYEAFVGDGDALITDERLCGVGVMTADCLPIVIYNKLSGAIGVVHAGWRSAASFILKKTIFEMEKNFSLGRGSLEIYFGPSACSCCYEVSSDFYKNFDKNSFCKEVFINKDGRCFFDNSLFNVNQLLELGICKKNIFLEYNFCTICKSSMEGGTFVESGTFSGFMRKDGKSYDYHSFRRDGLLSGRQATIVVLK